MTRTQRLMSKQVTIGLPHVVALILGLIAGGLQVLVVGGIIPLRESYKELVVVLLVFFAGVGINPLVGHNFYAALKLPAGVANAISALLAAGATFATSQGLPHATQAIILGVLTLAAALGFQPISPIAGEPVNVPIPEPEPIAPPPIVVTPPPVTQPSVTSTPGVTVNVNPPPPAPSEGEQQGVVT